MSSGACRALVAVLTTLVATISMTLPAMAEEPRLRERSTVRYAVDPSSGHINVRIILTLANNGNQPVNLGTWGPVYIEDRAERIQFGSGSDRAGDFIELPGPWKAMRVAIPRIDPTDQIRVTINYRIDGDVANPERQLADTPARIDDGYVYFCVVGQDTDEGTVSVELDSGFQTSVSGTPMEPTERPPGLTIPLTSNPVAIFSCIEGTDDRQLATSSFIGPAGRLIVLQAWPDRREWLEPAARNAEPTLDELHRFLGHDIPGEGEVVIRQAPSSTIGGYASLHDTPGVVQLDETAGVFGARHELAHAWFGTDDFTEIWMREGMAEWVASSIEGETCPPVTGEAVGVDLSDWQVLKPTAPGNIQQVIEDQHAAACGIVSAIASRMDEQQWGAVLGSLLEAETKYVGSGTPAAAPTTRIDYREWLDAVDERGLVPAGNTDLDFAQDLLEAYGIPNDSQELLERSAARSRYHEFVADAAPLRAPVAVREAMDNWDFGVATANLDRANQVLGALREADALLPEAGLIPVIQPSFEAARTTDELDAVLENARILRDEAGEIIPPLSELQEASPEGWGLPAAVRNAITDQRFGDVLEAIEPARDIASDAVAADAFLPEAELLERYRSRYEATAGVEALEQLSDELREIRVQAEQTGIALATLQGQVGEWVIPAAVTDPIAAGQLTNALVILEDARGVVRAAQEADRALPEANLSAGIRPQFEAVQSAAQMSALRSSAQEIRDDAVAVGDALNTLRERAAGWEIPAVVSRPIEERDFATAAQTAAEAQRWIEFADRADQDLEEMQALERTRPAFESAETLDDLRAGAELAEQWANAAARVGEARRVVEAPTGLLADLGLWGTDVRPTLDEAVEAAVAGDVQRATALAAEVISVINNGASSGGLRLAGLVFFGVAVLGVLGMWYIFRREAGPPWARQTTPHWVKNKDRKLLGRGGKPKPKPDKKAPAPPPRTRPGGRLGR